MTTIKPRATRVCVQRAKTIHSPAELSTMPYLTPREVAQMLRITQDTVYRAIQVGDLDAENYGSGRRPIYRISADAVRAWRTSRAVVPSTDNAGRK